MTQASTPSKESIALTWHQKRALGQTKRLIEQTRKWLCFIELNDDYRQGELHFHRALAYFQKVLEAYHKS